MPHASAFSLHKNSEFKLYHARQDANDVQSVSNAISNAIPKLSVLMLEVADDPIVSQEIIEAFKHARFVMVFLSTRFEVVDGDPTFERAVEGAITTFPVRLDDCGIPESLSDLQWIDLFETGSLERLVQSIKDEFHTFVDSRDGRKYRTVDIGDKTWLAENLNYLWTDRGGTKTKLETARSSVVYARGRRRWLRVQKVGISPMLMIGKSLSRVLGEAG